MKKLLLIGLIAAALLLSGCAEEDNGTSITSTDTGLSFDEETVNGPVLYLNEMECDIYSDIIKVKVSLYSHGGSSENVTLKYEIVNGSQNRSVVFGEWHDMSSVGSGMVQDYFDVPVTFEEIEGTDGQIAYIYGNFDIECDNCGITVSDAMNPQGVWVATKPKKWDATFDCIVR